MNDSITILDEGRKEWSKTTFAERKKLVLDYSNHLEDHMEQAASNLVINANKTYSNAISEVREAVDFIRYYAEQAETLYNQGNTLGYTGESNTTTYQPHGVWMVIAPWNFPLAIFVGPIIAALLTGNTVLAKSAPHKQLELPRLLISCMLECGIPDYAIRLCPSDPEDAEIAVADERINGITFTGSHKTAKRIQRVLADRDGPIIPFIAETGGINCMIADSTCLRLNNW